MDSTIFLAKILAIPSGFILGSYNAVFSQNVIPHLYAVPPSISAPIFAKIYYRGASTIVPIAATAIASYGYLAYNSSNPSHRNRYMVAAVLTFGTLPFTQLVMMPGISRLIEISKEKSLMAKAEVNGEVAGLLRTWVMQNAFRASLNLTAGLVGLYAALV